jgi:hypothetical protein
VAPAVVPVAPRPRTRLAAAPVVLVLGVASAGALVRDVLHGEAQPPALGRQRRGPFLNARAR